jgi:hypothetical protein
MLFRNQVITSQAFGNANEVNGQNIHNVLNFFNIEAKKASDEYARALRQKNQK